MGLRRLKQVRSWSRVADAPRKAHAPCAPPSPQCSIVAGRWVHSQRQPFPIAEWPMLPARRMLPAPHPPTQHCSSVQVTGVASGPRTLRSDRPFFFPSLRPNAQVSEAAEVSKAVPQIHRLEGWSPPRGRGREGSTFQSC